MEEFQQAQNAVKGLQSDPGNDTKLILYALFKQATKGDVTGDAPSMFDMVGKAKYSKWESFKGLSQEDAKVQYISIVKSLCPNGALPEHVSTSTASEAISATTAPALPPTPPLLDIAYPRMSGEGTTITKLAPELESIKLSMTDNGVLRVQLNRESTGNAFNMRMWHEITQVFDTVNRDSSVKVCVLTGGAKTFSTGMDLSVFAEMNQMAEREKCPGRLREGLFSVIKYLQNAISGPEKCRVPVIAAISGNCIGGAIDLITACDMRYSSDDAVFCIKETDLAIVADIGTTQRLPKLVGDSQAREWCYTARNVSATEAREKGLLLETFSSAEELERHVSSVADTIAAKSPITIRGLKSTLLYTRDNTVEAGLDYVGMHNSAQLYSSDLMEAMRAVMSKEAPTYKDP